MLAKRIIPCLDIKDGQTVKGTNFVDLRQAGDPVELGKHYSDEGADELVFLDITASHEKRKTFVNLVQRVAANINIPFTVGGGINELADVERLLQAGADKVSVNSAAIRCPQLIDDIASHFGSQVCVVAIDAQETPDGWMCYLNGGRIRTDKGGVRPWRGRNLVYQHEPRWRKNRICQRCACPLGRHVARAGHRIGRSRHPRTF